MLDIRFIQHVGEGHVFYTHACDSTQTEIQRLIERGAMGLMKEETPLCLLTDYQAKGMGQRGNAWISQGGVNLLMTIAFPLQKKQEATLIQRNKALAVALSENLANTIKQKIEIKWPNDIIYNDLKLGGILLETAQIQNQKFLLMGIGINVNQTSFESNLSATSMLIASELGHHNAQEAQPLSIESMAISVFESLQLAWKNPTPYATRYLHHLYQKDNHVRFLEVNTNEIFQAQILDVNEVGQIVVKRDDGCIYAYHHGEVRLMYR